MVVPAGFGQAFGEMAPAAKHAISHRAAAFAQLAAAGLPARQGRRYGFALVHLSVESRRFGR